MEPQQNNRIKTTFLIKSPVRVIPPTLITFSSGCMCIANHVSPKNLSIKAASAIKPAVYRKLYMQRCTSDWQM